MIIPRDLRHALVIAQRELVELWHERGLMVVAGLFTLGFPAYLGWVSAMAHVRPSHIIVWALSCGLEPIFLAAMMMVNTFIAERDQGILPTLLATPISNLALFGGKTLPIIVLGVAMGWTADGVLVAALWLKNPLMLSRLTAGLVVSLLMMVLCATLVVAGVGIIIVSRIRSSRSASLALTFASLAILTIEFALALWLTANPIGRALAIDLVVSQAALGIATLTLAANTYRRETIIAQL